MNSSQRCIQLDLLVDQIDRYVTSISYFIWKRIIYFCNNERVATSSCVAVQWVAQMFHYSDSRIGARQSNDRRAPASSTSPNHEGRSLRGAPSSIVKKTSEEGGPADLKPRRKRRVGRGKSNRPSWGREPRHRAWYQITSPSPAPPPPLHSLPPLFPSTQLFFRLCRAAARFLNRKPEHNQTASTIARLALKADAFTLTLSAEIDDFVQFNISSDYLIEYFKKPLIAKRNWLLIRDLVKIIVGVGCVIRLLTFERVIADSGCFFFRCCIYLLPVFTYGQLLFLLGTW